MFRMIKDAYKRDQALADNLWKSQFMPSGSGLMVKPETHEELRLFRTTYLSKPFKKPDFAVFNHDYYENEVD